MVVCVGPCGGHYNDHYWRNELIFRIVVEGLKNPLTFLILHSIRNGPTYEKMFSRKARNLQWENPYKKGWFTIRADSQIEASSQWNATSIKAEGWWITILFSMDAKTSHSLYCEVDWFFAFEMYWLFEFDMILEPRRIASSKNREKKLLPQVSWTGIYLVDRLVWVATLNDVPFEWRGGGVC